MAGEEVESFKFSAADIGVGLLESITLGLYREASDVLREYISNEIDSNPPPSSVHVDIDQPNRTIRVEGDGSGMGFSAFRDAVKIGVSFKDPKTTVGFRGIGIWAGVAACNKLRVATKSDSEQFEYELRVDCAKLRSYFSSGPNRNVPLIEALNECAVYVKRKSGRPCGTEVTLEGVTEPFHALLDETVVRTYLSTVSPVAFEDGFKFAGPIDSYLKKWVPGYRRVKIYLGQSPVRGLHIPDGVRAPITREIAVKLGSAKRPITLGYYWLAPPLRVQRIPEGFDSGIRIRVKNFTVVGPHTVRTTLAEAANRKKNLHYFDYWVGEIHATHPALKPNADRNDLEASVEKDALEGFIVSDIFTNSIVPLTRAISELYNLNADAKTALEETSSLTRAAYPDLQAAYDGKREITDQIEALERNRKALNDRLRLHRAIDGIGSIRDEWTQHTEAKVKRAISHLKAIEKRFDQLIASLPDPVGSSARSGEDAPADQTNIEGEDRGEARADDEVDATPIVNDSGEQDSTGGASPAGENQELLKAARAEGARIGTFSSAPAVGGATLAELVESGRIATEEELREFAQAVIRRIQREG
ncbi:MAG: ATP-binding protein [Nitrososphaerota archaeon]|nr:ATP-binding protein [Nitrososphaerota archaeon]